MFTLLITLLIGIIIYNLVKNKNRFYFSTQIPGPWFIPLIGNIQLASMKPEKVLKTVQKYRNKYQKSFRLWLGPKLWIFLHSSEEAKQALNHPDLQRADDFQMLRPLIGDGLLVSEGGKWIKRRRALMPAFHPKILDDFIITISQHADILMDILNDDQQQKECEISDYFFNCILDTICETSMGAEINSQNNPECLYAKAFHDAMQLLFERMVNPLLAFDVIYGRTNSCRQLKSSIKIIHDLTNNVIDGRRKLLTQSKSSSDHIESDDCGIKKRLVLLDILLNNENEADALSNDEIRDEVNTFLLAGVDTTKSAMSFIAYNLAKYPELQASVRNEVMLECAGIINMNKLRELKLLDQFLKESQRIYTTVPLTGRQTYTKIKINTLNIPENVTVWVNMYGLAHDPNIFSKPYEFQINRFDGQQTIEPYTFLPFSAGPHICIGKRYAELILKIITIKLLINYEISLQYPDEQLELISEMVLKSKTGINLILKKI